MSADELLSSLGFTKQSETTWTTGNALTNDPPWIYAHFGHVVRIQGSCISPIFLDRETIRFSIPSRCHAEIGLDLQAMTAHPNPMGALLAVADQIRTLHELGELHQHLTFGT